jgi:hypothetical protein
MDLYKRLQAARRRFAENDTWENECALMRVERMYERSFAHLR